jgi:MFS family permease
MNSNEGQNNTNEVIAKKVNLWNINYINTLIVTLIINVAAMILITILPLYTKTIGGDNFIAGLLTTLLTISAFLCRPIFGKMIDSVGRRRVLILGLGMFALSTLMLLASYHLYVLLFLRLLQGVGLSAYSTALGTILSDVVPNERLSEGVGYFGIASTIAMAIGPSIGLFITEKFSYQATYIVSSCIALSGILFANFIKYEKERASIKLNMDEPYVISTASIETMSQLKKSGFIEKTALRPCFVMFFTVMAISAVFSFMPLFGLERNIDNIGLFFTFYALSMIFSRLLTGRIADRYGFAFAYIPGMIITFLLFLTLSFAYSLPMVLLAAVFYGVGYGTVQPVVNAVVIKLCPPERRGAANATYYATLDIGFGLGSFVWGYVSQVAGFTTVFLICAALVAISVLIYYVVLHRQIHSK